MSHMWMSHVTHVNESCHSCEWFMSRMWRSHVTRLNDSCHTHNWVMSHMVLSHVKRVNESCVTWVMPNVWMSHAWHDFGVLNRVASRCEAQSLNELQHTTRCSTLQHTQAQARAHFHTQHTATHYNTLQHTEAQARAHFYVQYNIPHLSFLTCPPQ